MHPSELQWETLCEGVGSARGGPFVEIRSANTVCSVWKVLEVAGLHDVFLILFCN